jgi:hypothetical protein
MSRLTGAEREQLYDLLGRALDAQPPGTEAVFLAQLVLLLAEDLGSLEAVRGRIDALLGVALLSDAGNP